MQKLTFSFYDWRMRLKQLGRKGSKAQAARILGINPHTYSKYEDNPKDAPRAYKLAAIAIILGYDDGQD